MAKAYILTEADFDALFAAVDRDPRRGESGGSSAALSDEERRAHDKAHRWFNYQVRAWADKVKS